MSDGREILAEVQATGFADPDLDYDAVIADLAMGTPPSCALTKHRAGGIGSRIVSKRQLELADELVAIARAPYIATAPRPEPPRLDWARIADDLQRTTGRRLEVALRWEVYADDAYLDVRPRPGRCPQSAPRCNGMKETTQNRAWRHSPTGSARDGSTRRSGEAGRCARDTPCGRSSGTTTWRLGGVKPTRRTRSSSGNWAGSQSPRNGTYWRPSIWFNRGLVAVGCTDPGCGRLGLSRHWEVAGSSRSSELRHVAVNGFVGPCVDAIGLVPNTNVAGVADCRRVDRPMSAGRRACGITQPIESDRALGYGKDGRGHLLSQDRCATQLPRGSDDRTARRRSWVWNRDARPGPAQQPSEPAIL